VKKILKNIIVHPEELTDKEHWWFKKPLIVICGSLLAIVVFVNLAFQRPPALSELTLQQRAKFYVDQEHPDKAITIYNDLLQTDSTNIDLHFGLITAHYELPASVKSSRKDHDTSHIWRDDETIKSTYSSLATDPDSVRSDIGNYCSGLCSAIENQYITAIESFQKVKNHSLKYLNNSLGRAYLFSNVRLTNKDSVAKAIVTATALFKKEISNNGNIEGAFSNLFALLFGQERWKDIINLLHADGRALQYCPDEIERLAYFHEQDLFGYIVSCFHRFTNTTNRFGFIAAFLILLAWLYYLRKVDVFQSERWKYIISTCLIGMCAAFLVFPITDLFKNMIGYEGVGKDAYGLFYCIFGIGVVEEVVKIIPLLLGILLTKEIEEPIDFIIYASVSALGFAFIENLEYFDLNHLNIIHGRAMLTAFIHVFCSSIIAYYLILGKYRGKNLYRMFFAGLLLAALVHGCFDYLVINDDITIYRILVILLSLMCVVQFRLFISNALSISPRYDDQRTFDTHGIKLHLSYYLTGILLLEYLFVSYHVGAASANVDLRDAVVSGSFLIFWLSNQLGNVTLQKDQWLIGTSSVFRRTFKQSVLMEAGKELLSTGYLFLICGAIVLSITTNPAYAIFIGGRILYVWRFGKKESDDEELELNEDSNTGEFIPKSSTVSAKGDFHYDEGQKKYLENGKTVDAFGRPIKT